MPARAQGGGPQNNAWPEKKEPMMFVPGSPGPGPSTHRSVQPFHLADVLLRSHPGASRLCCASIPAPPTLDSARRMGM